MKKIKQGHFYPNTKKVRAGETRRINDAKTRGHKSTITNVINETVEHAPRTHASTTRNMKNIELQENPDPKDKKKSYMLPKIQKTNIKNVGKKIRGEDIKNPVDKSILRHLKNQEKKKKRRDVDEC